MTTGATQVKGETALEGLLARISSHNATLTGLNSRLTSAINRIVGAVPADEGKPEAPPVGESLLIRIDSEMSTQADIIQGLVQQTDRLEEIA